MVCTICSKGFLDVKCLKKQTDCPYIHDAQMAYYGIVFTNDDCLEAKIRNNGGICQALLWQSTVML
jgi:rRNA-processing protein FCF1